MKQSYPKKEKLKSRSLINLLFSEGKSVSKYPLRLVYREVDYLEDTQCQMGVSVSKKYFKKAVDRNYYKRLMRETYRCNKDLLQLAMGDKKYVFMLLYQTKDRLNFQEVQEKTVQLFEKFAANLSKDS